jgi:hypothetical protein
MAGPFYLAYIDEDEAFSPSVHNVEDEQIHSFVLEQAEGEFASLEIELENPRAGALAPGRQQWVFFSWDRAWQPSGSWVPDIVLLFKGRVLAVPSNIQDEIIQLTFIARPSDYQDQKAALAETLKERPYWDPIWFDPDKLADPDNILESRPALWHISRTDNSVSISHILNGEDGTITLTEDDIFYDNTKVDYGEVPLKTVNMTATVAWDQTGADAIDISSQFAFGGFNAIYTYTGPGLRDSWPKSGAKLGNGWEVDQGECLGEAPNPVWGYRYSMVPNAPTIPFSFDQAINRSAQLAHDFPDAITVICPTWYENVQPLLQSIFISKVMFVPLWHMLPVMTVRYEVTRKYNEVLTISLTADVQDIMSDAGGQDTVDLAMSSSELMSPIDDYGDIPIGDVRRRTFFATDRGATSIEYLIALMRSRLLIRARCVELTFETDFRTAIDNGVTLRKNLVMLDTRFPDGQVAGKIIGYRMSLDGDDGALIAEVKIGASAGRNGAIAAVPGVGVYANTGYMKAGYQRETGGHVVPFAGDVAYVPINGLPANDDGVDLMTLHSGNIILSLVKENSSEDQKAHMPHAVDNPQDVFDKLNEVPTRFTLTMLPLEGGPFETIFNVATTDLKIPRTINLEAGYV